MKNPSIVSNLFWFLFIPILFFSSLHSSAQSSNQQFLSVNMKFSETVFGETVYGLSVSQRHVYYSPIDFGMGVEVAYENRSSKYGFGINLGMTNLKFISTNRVNEYDVQQFVFNNNNARFLELQVVGKRYIPLGPLEVDIQLGIGVNRHLGAEFQNSLLLLRKWGIQTIAGSSMIFPVTDRLSITFGARYIYQVNKYFKPILKYYSRTNNSTLHFLFGTKFRLGAKS